MSRLFHRVPAVEAAALAASLVAALVACSSSPGTTAAAAGGSAAAKPSGTVVVFAATSLTDAFNKIATQFETAHPGVSVKFNYNGSSSLATQITQGAPADVFASASPTNMDTVTGSTSSSSTREASCGPASSQPPSRHTNSEGASHGA